MLAAGTGGAWLLQTRKEQEVSRLIAIGRDLRASGRASAEVDAAALFKRAVVRDPARGDAWGWLSVTLVGDGATGNQLAQEAAERALALDPHDPNARVTIAVLRRDLDDWVRYENDLLSILKDAPDCAPALGCLTLFLQSVGRCKDSLVANERAIAIEPFSPQHQARRAMTHWIFGRIAEADKVADRSIQLSQSNRVERTIDYLCLYRSGPGRACTAR